MAGNKCNDHSLGLGATVIQTGTRDESDSGVCAVCWKTFIYHAFEETDMTGAITTVVLQESAALIVFLIPLVLAVISIAGMWKTFTKANQPGWAALIPIYNVYVMLKIGNNEWWWLLVLFVPIIQLYAAYRVFRGVADAFGQGIGFTLGLWFLGFIFFPILGFGDYSYRGHRGGGAQVR